MRWRSSRGAVEEQDEELVLAVLQHLPLKEDFEEYKLVAEDLGTYLASTIKHSCGHRWAYPAVQ